MKKTEVLRSHVDKLLTGFIWYMAIKPVIALRLQLLGAFTLAIITLTFGFILVESILWAWTHHTKVFNGFLALLCASTIAWLIRMK